MNEKKEKKSSKKKGKKVDPGFVLFLNKYHKAIWAAKFNCKLVQEKEDDELEVCEEVCIRTWLLLLSFIQSIRDMQLPVIEYLVCIQSTTRHKIMMRMATL